MNGAHDMGGMHGFGGIRPRENEESFHADWERRVPGIGAAGRGINHIYNIDEFRYGIERMDPVAYLTASYYERHLVTHETNLVEKGVLSREEIEARMEQLRHSPTAAVRRDDPAVAEQVIRNQLTSALPPPPDHAQARFRPGDAVITRNTHPGGHTRLPRYARGKHGTIERFHGVDTLPDASAQGRGPSPEPLYSVRFAAAELWGDSADGPGAVYLDLWESYLESAKEHSR